MKICEICKRELKGKRWVKPSRKALAHAKLMKDVEWTKCSDCLRHSQSHNAILQIRGRFDEDEVEGVVAGVIDDVNDKDRRERVFFGDGNYYSTSKNLLKTAARRLRDMGAEIKETSKVVTHDMQRSVPLTRLVISARFTVRKGDVVKTGGGFDVVSRVSKGWVWTRGGHKMKVKNAEVIDAERLEGIVVSEKPPLVLIKATNETVEVDFLSAEQGKETTVVRADGYTTTV